MNAIEIRGLTKRYGTRTAVDNLSLNVAHGQLFALLGQNGAGKTTTIRMLCGLVPPTSGDALLGGKSICREAQAAKQVTNVSPQETAIAPNLTVRENLELFARIYGANRAAATEKAASLMETFGLTDRAKDRAKTLSGGMQRRLSIAMALISDPQVVFLDEPTLGLDVRARRDLWRAIEALKGKVTVVLTTHYLEEAEALSDEIGILHEGRLRALGTAEALKAKMGTDSFEEAFLALTDPEAEVSK